MGCNQERKEEKEKEKKKLLDFPFRKKSRLIVPTHKVLVFMLSYPYSRFRPFLGTKSFSSIFRKSQIYFVPKKGRNHKGANIQPPRPSKHRGRNHQHASTSHEVCINHRVQHGSLIPRRLHSGAGWIWRWIGFSRVFTSKNIIDQPSVLRDRTRDARKTGVCCGLQKKAVSSLIPTLILYWIFRPFFRDEIIS